MSRLKTTIMLTAMFGLCSTSFEWNDTGHRIVAVIACQSLNDADKKKVLEILKAHPHYEEYLAKDIPSTADKGEWIAMRAATWPDCVRPVCSGPTS